MGCFSGTGCADAIQMHSHSALMPKAHPVQKELCSHYPLFVCIMRIHCMVFAPRRYNAKKRNDFALAQIRAKEKKSQGKHNPHRSSGRYGKCQCSGGIEMRHIKFCLAPCVKLFINVCMLGLPFVTSHLSVCNRVAPSQCSCEKIELSGSVNSRGLHKAGHPVNAVVHHITLMSTSESQARMTLHTSAL